MGSARRRRRPGNRFEFFLPEDPAGQLDRLTFDATPKLPGWEPPGAWVYKPKLKRGNFLSFMGSGALSASLIVAIL